MSRVVAGSIVVACVLAVLAGCAESGAPPGGPGSVTTSLHGQTVVTFGSLPR